MIYNMYCYKYNCMGVISLQKHHMQQGNLGKGGHGKRMISMG